MEIVELVGTILTHVSSAEERVFLRVWLRTYAVGQASCRATFEDLARDAALSWTTTKTALLKLEGKGVARHCPASQGAVYVDAAIYCDWGC
jgi:predicted transcriptional regulator